MLAKLLSLLIHAKFGLLSGVLLLGATGALVSVSASNGVTTITITQPSASPSTAVTTATRTPEPSESAEPSESPKLSSSTASTACTDEATAIALQVQRVDTAFSGYHTDLMHLRGTRSVVVIETADVTLKNIRQAAVKAIHATATATCAKQDDEDTTENDQNDEKDTEDANDTSAVTTTVTTVAVVNNDTNDESNDGDHGKTTTTPVTFTGTAQAIADQALAAMKVAFDAANTSPVLTPKPDQKDGKKADSEHHD